MSLEEATWAVGICMGQEFRGWLEGARQRNGKPTLAGDHGNKMK
jgi:hypothetical protein